MDNNDKILISQGIEERFSSENEYQVVKNREKENMKIIDKLKKSI